MIICHLVGEVMGFGGSNGIQGGTEGRSVVRNKRIYWGYCRKLFTNDGESLEYYRLKTVMNKA